jgi:hypothetical protein
MRGKFATILGLLALCSVALSLSGLATTGEMYFASDKNGQNRVTNVQEGDEIWIVVIDGDQNTDCDTRDKMSPDLKIMDPKTGAYIVWAFNPNFAPDHILADDDYLEETGADTGVFVSVRAFQVGTRYSFAEGEPWRHTHVVDIPGHAGTDDFQWGNFEYIDNDDGDAWDGVANDYSDNRIAFAGSGVGTNPDHIFNFNPNDGRNPAVPDGAIAANEYLIGRFENMDTLIGLYQDPNDETDVALSMMKIIDTEATIAWSQEVYEDANSAATITIVDPDENLNCNEVELVPVFIIVNPGSWNPVDAVGANNGRSPTNFCMLKQSGGVDGTDGTVGDAPIRWFNIYNADANAAAPIGNGAANGRYYIEYPSLADIAVEDNVSFFDTVDADGITPVLFYAQETGANTGVFQLNLNSILTDLEFNSLNVRDVLVAYYLDPNDFDDFKLATAYIEEHQHSTTSFTDVNRADKNTYWLGRDPVYVQVVDSNANVDPCSPEYVLVHICDVHGEDDAEWIILDEVSSNSPVFLTYAGHELRAVWNGLGVGLADSVGGFQLQLDNWKIEAFNEDDIYARYNDVTYFDGRIARQSVVVQPKDVDRVGPINDFLPGLGGLGDVNPLTCFPPRIGPDDPPGGGPLSVVGMVPMALQPGVRVGNDLSFDMMSIGDTQVFDGIATNMYFLDRQGSRVTEYTSSDCVFVEVVDLDQDEDPYRRERIDGYWDGGQNAPFGAAASRVFQCVLDPRIPHPTNPLLGDTNVFGDEPHPLDSAPKIYIFNPRSGFWAAIDLLETGPSSGDFVSVTCIDLSNIYECAPSLRALPGDTIIAAYQDPSNHSDSAWISIKVGIGGGEAVPGQQSTTTFVDADGKDVSGYSDTDDIYVKVIDLSHAGATLLADAVEIEGLEYDLLPLGTGGEFTTEAIDLDLSPGDEIMATFTDPTNPQDTSSATIGVASSVLTIESFVASPNPFEIDVTFSYVGTGVASLLTLSVYDLSGHLVQELSNTDVSEIVWDGTKGARCSPVANGAYIYVVTATDGTNTFSQKGTVFVNR